MTKILLVEDNEMNRDMLLRRLQRRGFDVSIAVDGAESIEVVRRDRPDLILMDMSLPVMDGYQATRILKDNPDTRSIPVLGLSAHAMTGDAERAMDAGCDDYDTKPVEIKRLLGKIGALLERAGAAAGDSVSQGETEPTAAPTDVPAKAPFSAPSPPPPAPPSLPKVTVVLPPIPLPTPRQSTPGSASEPEKQSQPRSPERENHSTVPLPSQPEPDEGLDEPHPTVALPSDWGDRESPSENADREAGDTTGFDQDGPGQSSHRETDS